MPHGKRVCGVPYGADQRCKFLTWHWALKVCLDYRRFFNKCCLRVGESPEMAACDYTCTWFTGDSSTMRRSRYPLCRECNLVWRSIQHQPVWCHSQLIWGQAVSAHKRVKKYHSKCDSKFEGTEICKYCSNARAEKVFLSLALQGSSFDNSLSYL